MDARKEKSTKVKRRFSREITVIVFYGIFAIVLILAFIVFGRYGEYELRFGIFWLAGFFILTLVISIVLWLSFFRKWKGLKRETSSIRKTLASLRKSKKLYGELVENMDEAIWSADINGNFTFIGPSIEMITGYSVDEFMHYSLRELIPKKTYVKTIGKLTRLTGNPGAHTSLSVAIPVERLTKSGARVWLEFAMKARWADEDKLEGFQGIIRNITKRKEDESRHNRLNRIRNMLRELKYIRATTVEEKKLLESVCRAALDVGGYRYAWMGYALKDSEKTVRPVAQRGFPEKYFDYAKITWADNIWGVGPVGRAIRTGKPAIAQKLDKEEFHLHRFSDNVLRRYGSSIAIPLKDEEGVFGAFSLYSIDPDSFGKEEVKMLLKIGKELSAAIGMLAHSQREHDRSERALRESEDRFTAFMNHLPAAVFLKDETSRMIYVNPYMRRHFGADALMGKSPHEYLPKDIADAIISDDNEALAKGYKSLLESHEDLKGKERIFQTEKFAIQREGNPPLLGGIELDITERKRAEEELKRKLIQTQNLYQLSKDLMYSDTQEDVCHKALLSICAGFSLGRGLLFIVDNLLGRLDLKEMVGFEDVDVHLEAPLDKCNGILGQSIENMEYLCVTLGNENSTGEKAVLPSFLVDSLGFPGPEDSYIITPIHSKETVFAVLFLDFGEDVSFPEKGVDMLAMYLSAVATAFENVGLYQKLEDSYESLKEIDKKRSDFIDVAAHELRTPLSSIKIYTDLMSREQIGSFSEKEMSYLDDMNANIKHLNELINEMLDYTRTNAKMLNFPIGEYEMTGVAKEIMEDFRTVAATRGISLELESEGDSIARFNLELMRKAVKNLVSNAVKYSHDGGDIIIGITGDTHTVTVAVTDNGIGIPEEHISRIFERFYMGDMSLTRERDKMGLGLPITKSIAEGHGGRISAESQVGKGSTFRFTVPRRLKREPSSRENDEGGVPRPPNDEGSLSS